jgi:hypothetical protein
MEVLRSFHILVRPKIIAVFSSSARPLLKSGISRIPKHIAQGFSALLLALEVTPRLCSTELPKHTLF